MDSNATGGRLKWTGWIFALAFLGLFARLVWLQVCRADYYVTRADRQQICKVVLPALRGSILDRKLRPLAVSVPIQSVYVDPSEVAPAHMNYVVRRLARITGCQAGELEAKIIARREARFVWVARHLDDFKTQRVQAARPAVLSRAWYCRSRRCRAGGR